MARVTGGVTTKRRHKKILKLAKGYRNIRRTSFRRAKEAVMKAGMHAYVGRKQKKRDFRGLWIIRINAALRAHDMKYSRFIGAMTEKSIIINRKMLSEIAIHHPEAFGKIVAAVK